MPKASCQMEAVATHPGHGNFPYLCGNLNDVVVSPLLYTCYQNSQSISRAYEQYGASTVQPISEETQLLLTVYYLVQLGEPPSPFAGTTGGRLARGRKRTSLDHGPSRRAPVETILLPSPCGCPHPEGPPRGLQVGWHLQRAFKDDSPGILGAEIEQA